MALTHGPLTAFQLEPTPLQDLRERLAELPTALRVLVLVAGFDTEVTLHGLQAFLDGPMGGARLGETISAFEAIGAWATARVLKATRGAMPRHLDALEATLYIHAPIGGEDVHELLHDYLEPRQQEVLRALGRN